MQGAFGFMDFIILLMVAAFIVSRFMGHNLPKEDPKDKEKLKNIVPFPEMTPTEKPKVVQKPMKKDIQGLSGVAQIQAMDPSFNEKEFLSGATSAYDMYIDAYNERDEEALDALLAPKKLDEVMDDIEALEEDGKQRLFVLEKMENVEIIDAKLHGRTAIIDVKYTALQKESVSKIGTKPSAVRSKAKEISQIWTWARNIDSDDLNWELESTSLLS